MAQTDDKAEVEETDDKVTDEEGAKLLGSKAGAEDDDPEGADQLGDAGQRALESIKEQRRKAREERAAEKRRADDLAAQLKQYQDKDKSELERTASERDEYKTRAEQAEDRVRRRELAEELAPTNASPKVIAQVARRMQGDDEDALKADAMELFELLAPASGSNGKPPAKRGGSGTGEGKPRGGADPSDDLGETDPYKLAALIPRRR